MAVLRGQMQGKRGVTRNERSRTYDERNYWSVEG